MDVDYFESDIKHEARQKDVIDVITKGIEKGDEINKLILELVS